jgi:hypothetical protein
VALTPLFNLNKKKMNTIIKTLLILSLCTGCSKEKSLSQIAWADNVNNPENREFVVEVAFNENVEIWQVTQAQFNERYDIGQ